jgi:hypothetical protein
MRFRVDTVSKNENGGETARPNRALVVKTELESVVGVGDDR